MSNIREIVKKINNESIETIKTLSIEDLEQLLVEAEYAYHNTNKPFFDDNTYDIIKEHLKKRDPKNPILKNTGAPIKKDVKKVELPYWMGSMDKIKPDSKEIDNFGKKYPGTYLISDKLDGVSGMLYYENGNHNLYTRGNGKIGQDITNLIPYINGLQQPEYKYPYDKFVVRGELIMTKDNFEQFSKENANPRNTVSGVVNSKKPNMKILKNIDFIGYEVIEPSGLTPEEQVSLMASQGLKPVYNKVITKKELTSENLSSILSERREKSIYEIDGIIVSHNSVYKRSTSGNPKYAFAFKTLVESNRAETTVLKVEWNVSKDKLLKPIVHIQPVKLMGVLIKKATGFNAKFIEENIIGPGSIIIITRSGDVIPHITQVLKEATNGKPSLPTTDYEWVSEFEIKQKGITKESQLKDIENFIVKMKVEGLSKGLLKKLFENGHDTIKKIINIKKEDLLKIEGFKEKASDNVIKAINKVFGKELDCIQVLVASNTLGRGFAEKKIRLVIDEYPEVVKGKTPTINQLVSIEGIQTKSAENFIKGISVFQSFLKENGLKCSLKKETVGQETTKLTGKTIVFTGFRDKDLEARLTSTGNKVTTTVSKNTSYLVVKDPEETSSKITKAKTLGVPVLSKEEFLKLL